MANQGRDWRALSDKLVQVGTFGPKINIKKILIWAYSKSDFHPRTLIYLMSYELCLMSYLMSYVILSPYDLTALVHVLLLGLRLTFSRLVWMHFVLCRFLRILEDMSFLQFLRILNLINGGYKIHCFERHN